MTSQADRRQYVARLFAAFLFLPAGLLMWAASDERAGLWLLLFAVLPRGSHRCARALARELRDAHRSAGRRRARRHRSAAPAACVARFRQRRRRGRSRRRRRRMGLRSAAAARRRAIASRRARHRRARAQRGRAGVRRRRRRAAADRRRAQPARARRPCVRSVAPDRTGVVDAHVAGHDDRARAARGHRSRARRDRVEPAAGAGRPGDGEALVTLLAAIATRSGYACSRGCSAAPAERDRPPSTRRTFVRAAAHCLAVSDHGTIDRVRPPGPAETLSGVRIFDVHLVDAANRAHHSRREPGGEPCAGGGEADGEQIALLRGLAHALQIEDRSICAWSARRGRRPSPGPACALGRPRGPPTALATPSGRSARSASGSAGTPGPGRGRSAPRHCEQEICLTVARRPRELVGRRARGRNSSPQETAGRSSAARGRGRSASSEAGRALDGRG